MALATRENVNAAAAQNLTQEGLKVVAVTTRVTKEEWKVPECFELTRNENVHIHTT